MFKFTYQLVYTFVDDPATKEEPKKELYYSCDEPLEGSYVLERKQYDSAIEQRLSKVFFSTTMQKKRGWKDQSPYVKVKVKRTYENHYEKARKRSDAPYFEDEFYRYFDRLARANDLLNEGEDSQPEKVAKALSALDKHLNWKRITAPLSSLAYNLDPESRTRGKNDLFVRLRQVWRSAIELLNNLLYERQLIVSLDDQGRSDLQLLHEAVIDHVLEMQEAIFDLCDTTTGNSRDSIRHAFFHYRKQDIIFLDEPSINLIDIFEATQDRLVEIDYQWAGSRNQWLYKEKILERWAKDKHLQNLPPLPIPPAKGSYPRLITCLTEAEVRKLYEVLLEYKYIDQTIDETDFVAHIMGNQEGYVPLSKIMWLVDQKCLVILMIALGTNKWKQVSKRFATYRNDDEDSFYNSLKNTGSAFLHEMKDNNPYDNTESLAMSVVRIIDKVTGDADKIIGKNYEFWGRYI